MKRKRITEEQIIGVLKEAEARAKTDHLARRPILRNPLAQRRLADPQIG